SIGERGRGHGQLTAAMSLAKIGELDHRPFRPLCAADTCAGLNMKTLTASVAIIRWMSPNSLVRSFGLAHVSPDSVVNAFPDLTPGISECPRGCSHDEEECGLDAFVAGDPHAQARLASLRRLLASRGATESGQAG
ncbi:MAG: hypothetical protein ACO3CU_11895, partial [Candidatus Nanopelagicales bacterium]